MSVLIQFKRKLGVSIYDHYTPPTANFIYSVVSGRAYNGLWEFPHWDTTISNPVRYRRQIYQSMVIYCNRGKNAIPIPVTNAHRFNHIIIKSIRVRRMLVTPRIILCELIHYDD